MRLQGLLRPVRFENENSSAGSDDNASFESGLHTVVVSQASAVSALSPDVHFCVVVDQPPER